MAQSPNPSPKSIRLTPAKVVMLYVFIAALWIVGSGELLAYVVENPQLRERIEMFKGLAFVAVTGVLFYLLLKGWRESIYADKTADTLITILFSKATPRDTAPFEAVGVSVINPWEADPSGSASQ